MSGTCGENPCAGLRRVFGSPAAPVTFPARWPVLALDRIWISPAQALLTVEAHNTPRSRLASDHLPVKADLYPSLRRET
jgi:endonuclease/exonuclease/phosphatase family metal-dependent hydrolase